MQLGYMSLVTHLIVGAALVSSAPECRVGTSGVRVVRVHFFNQSRLTERSFRTITEVANRIWEPYGITIEAASQGEAINVVVSGEEAASRFGENAPAVIGTTMFSNGHATPNLRLSLGAAQRLADWFDVQDQPLRGRPTAALDAIVLRVLGVALAHELAHYLLDTPEHASEGLLRSRFTLREMANAHPAQLSLTCAQRRVLQESEGIGWALR